MNLERETVVARGIEYALSICQREIALIAKQSDECVSRSDAVHRYLMLRVLCPQADSVLGHFSSATWCKDGRDQVPTVDSAGNFVKP